MPKIKVISRAKEDFTRERRSDIVKVFRNPDPKLHPFERGREYTRALNATKLGKVFAKPFLGALDGHRDGIWAMSKVPNSLVQVFSGACDGELKLWNLADRSNTWSVQAHTGFVRGITVDTEGENVITCSEDKTVKIWKVDQSEALEDGEEVRPLSTLPAETPFSGIDHCRGSSLFATSSTKVDLWDQNRAEPLHSFQWGADSVYSVKFNQVQTEVLASTASDRNIVLYDVRAKTPLHKLIMKMSTNALCWNPQEAFNFTTACEDHNLYTFDMRKLESALTVHEDHVSAVMSIDYAPTGKEFVTGSYDRTMRFFGMHHGHSRECYHGRRMQRVFCVMYSADNRYVLSGSDDTNIRLWKARAAERISTLLPREQAQANYQTKLKQRFAHAPEVRRIERHQHVPKSIKNAKALKHIGKKSAATKDKRRRAHHKPDSIPRKNAKKANVFHNID